MTLINHIFYSKGFSLLETIVSITLISTFGLAIFAWINGLFISIDKIERNHKRDQLQRNVAEYLSDVNVMANTSGTREFSIYSITWSATLIEPERQGRSNTGNKNDFVLALYETQVNIKASATPVTDFKLRLLGYRSELNTQSFYE